MPEPDGPMIDTISPRGMDSVTSSSAVDLALAGELLGDAVEVDHGSDYVNSFTMLSNFGLFSADSSGFPRSSSARVASGTGIVCRVAGSSVTLTVLPSASR